MPDYTIGLLEGAHGELAGQSVVVLGAAYRGGVKETAFSGVFATVSALKGKGATVLVHDPLYSDDELIALGFTPYHLGDKADAAVVQANHAEYRTITSSDIPGVKTVVDGRRISTAEQWPDVSYRVIGKA